MADEAFEFDALIRSQHFQELTKAAQCRFQKSGGSRLQAAVFLFVSLAGALFFGYLADSVAVERVRGALLGPVEVAVLALATGLLAAIGLLVLTGKRATEAYVREALGENGSFLGSRHFTADDEGIRLDGAHGHSLTRWQAIAEMTEAPNTYLLWTDPGAAVMVPKDAFVDDAARSAFLRHVEERISANKNRSSAGAQMNGRIKT